jgi:thiol-disulfide isomerase/thioredoxin
MASHFAKKFNMSFIFFLVAIFFTEIRSSNVIELNSHNVDKIIDGSKFVFAFFYAPWNEQSQKVLGIYDEVGDEFARNDIIIAKANAYEDTKLATRYWIDRYPLFRFFIKGSKVEET